MSPELIGIITAALILGGLILRQGASLDKRLNKRLDDQNSHFNDRFDDLDKRLNRRLDDQNSHFNDRFDDLDKRLNRRLDDQNSHFNDRFDGLDKRFSNIEEKVAGLSTDVATLKATIETFFRVRIDPATPPPPEPRRERAA